MERGRQGIPAELHGGEDLVQARARPPLQGQGKADLATGYELDIIASAVVGGASLAGGRGSVVGAVLGALIFGVLRNALPQIPGATFYDRLTVGLAVIIIVVMDQVLIRRKK